MRSFWRTPVCDSITLRMRLLLLECAVHRDMLCLRRPGHGCHIAVAVVGVGLNAAEAVADRRSAQPIVLLAGFVLKLPAANEDSYRHLQGISILKEKPLSYSLANPTASCGACAHCRIHSARCIALGLEVVASWKSCEAVASALAGRVGFRWVRRKVGSYRQLFLV